ncbi:cytochrome-c peroxidase [Wenyingzhuangia aestuarii]|uniref:cytochrome-c peroxidase n=1 Tax=Wenyingzhuangia aestuarii TaxID=1647582 RepID=UPI00143AE3C0|nr:cytochrome c peroxidase [Wenyingzhuangia aestuarii]NJB83538.1 cytochrome c peroxidase [Wenyingzhuangia aestuarii]
MKNKRYSCWLALYVLSTGFLFAQKPVEGKATQLRTSLEPYFVAVEKNESFIKSNKEKIALGKRLFFDKQLSLGKGVSCNDCHDLQKYGTNGTYYLNQKNKENFYRDVPSVYNNLSYELFNVDGGVSNYAKKIQQAFTSQHEMGSNEDEIVTYLKESKVYKKEFKKAFPKQSKAILFKNVLEVMQKFMSELKTPAPIDAFITGDTNALTPIQIEGGILFVNRACYSCHTGSNFGGQMINKLGVEVPWPNQKDLGFYHLKKQVAYKMFFRVAPLRNVEKTAPYFHDATVVLLDKAIKLMGIHERGIQLKVVEIAKIKEFLKSFTGEIPKEYIKMNKSK